MVQYVFADSEYRLVVEKVAVLGPGTGEPSSRFQRDGRSVDHVAVYVETKVGVHTGQMRAHDTGKSDVVFRVLVMAQVGQRAPKFTFLAHKLSETALQSSGDVPAAQ